MSSTSSTSTNIIRLFWYWWLWWLWLIIPRLIILPLVPLVVLIFTSVNINCVSTISTTNITTTSSSSYHVQTLSSESITISSRTINTKYGVIKGNLVKLSSIGRRSSSSSSTSSNIVSISDLPDVEAYLGVPYATPPTGGLRFMPPVTPTHWRGVRMATKSTPVCPQHIPEDQLSAMRSSEYDAIRRMTRSRYEYLRRLIPMLGNQSEDCLYLNIYVPIVRSGTSTSNWSNAQSFSSSSSSSSSYPSSSLPVVVFIHGESYDWGSGNVFDGSILAAFGHTIVVTLNYRLGILGFLPAFVDGSVRGNYGLMDQVAALHWIQENIAEFGGSSTNVTIVGHGRGAACAHLLMLSPMAKGLFSRVVLMSGSALSPWAIVRDPEHYAKLLGKRFNCTNLDSMIDCLRTRKVHELTSIQLLVPDHLTAFGPIVDSIVVPLDPRRLYHTELYRQFQNLSNISHTFAPLLEQSLGRSVDLMLGGTETDSPCMWNENESRNGIDSNRLDRMIRTLVGNLYDYHQQSIFLSLFNEYSDWSSRNSKDSIGSSFPSVNILDSANAILSDSLILAPMVQTADLHALFTTAKNQYQKIHSSNTRKHSDDANSGRTYFFMFDVNGANIESMDMSSNRYDDKEHNVPIPKSQQAPTRLVCTNGYDLAYLFGDPIIQLQSPQSHLGPFYYGYNLTRIHGTISLNFMQYLINFIHVGDPNQRHGTYSGARSFWPAYEPHQTYLSLGSVSPKAYDHGQNHRLSLWLNLIPRLLMDDREFRFNQLLNTSQLDRSANPVQQLIDFALFNRSKMTNMGGSGVTSELQRHIGRGEPPNQLQQHHMLLDYDNTKSFDGIVRTPEMVIKSQNMNEFGFNIIETNLINRTNTINQSGEHGTMVDSYNHTNNFITNQTYHRNNDQLLDNSNILTQQTSTNNGNAFSDLLPATFINQNSQDQPTNTALLITIGIGCALLLFNVTIFIILYRQLDRNRKLVAEQQLEQQKKDQQKSSQTNSSVDSEKSDQTQLTKDSAIESSPNGTKYHQVGTGQLDFANNEILLLTGGTLSRTKPGTSFGATTSYSQMYPLEPISSVHHSTLTRNNNRNSSSNNQNNFLDQDQNSWNTSGRVQTIDQFDPNLLDPNQFHVPFTNSTTTSHNNTNQNQTYFCLVPNGPSTSTTTNGNDPNSELITAGSGQLPTYREMSV